MITPNQLQLTINNHSKNILKECATSTHTDWEKYIQKSESKAYKELLALIDSAKREGARQELEYMMTGEKTVTQYADNNFDDVVTYIFAASEIQERIAQLEQSKESKHE